MSSDNQRNDAYTQAVTSGKYDRETGLRGKYDNVRVYWEDEVTRFFLQPHIEKQLQHVSEKGRGLRILDLGCGSGDGYEMLMELKQREKPLGEDNIQLIQDDHLAYYKGIEINKDLLAQNAARWGENPKMDCCWGDFSQGLPVEKQEPSFDIYFTSYGALSHLNEDQTVRLFCDISRHAEDGALVVGDWLGRYAYEWQELWNTDISSEQWMDYYISYIYPPEVRKKVSLTPLHLRLLSLEEIERLIERVRSEIDDQFRISSLFDRSLLIGRHTDTGDYNSHLKPMRQTVNTLFEKNIRTDLRQMLIDYHSHPDTPEHNHFFENFFLNWNALIRYTIFLCGQKDGKEPSARDAALKNAMAFMDRVFDTAGRLEMDDPRADFIEPHLAYALRGLEMSLQKGQGYGHGLVGIFHVKKT